MFIIVLMAILDHFKSLRYFSMVTHAYVHHMAPSSAIGDSVDTWDTSTRCAGVAGGPFFRCRVDVPHTLCELGRQETYLPLCIFDPFSIPAWMKS